MSVGNVRWQATRSANRGGIRSGGGFLTCNVCVSKPRKARDACESALNVCGAGKSRRLFHGCRPLYNRVLPGPDGRALSAFARFENRASQGPRGLSAGSEVYAVRSLPTRARAGPCAVGNRAYQGPREGNLPIVREDVFIRPIKTYASHAGPLSNAGEPASPRRVASFLSHLTSADLVLRRWRA